jgi:hypothetical protein
MTRPKGQRVEAMNSRIPRAGEGPLGRLEIFLPGSMHDSLAVVVDALRGAGVDIEIFLEEVMALGERVIEAGLDRTADSFELLLNWVHDTEVLEKLGQYSPVARDGAEMGGKVILHALRTLEAEDVARLAAVVVVLMTMPKLLSEHGAQYLQLVLEVLGKLWDMS